MQIERLSLKNEVTIDRLLATEVRQRLGFHRTASGAEIDVVLTVGSRRVGLEVEFSAAPKPAREFWHAKQHLALDRAYVVAPVQRLYPLADDVGVLPVQLLQEAMST